MKNFDPGYVLFSRSVVREMGDDPRFACFVGKSLGRHVRGDSGRLKLEGWQTELASKVRRSAYREGNDWEVQVLTELDKNQMPRTSVVLPGEGGCL